MAALNDLINQITDTELRDRIQCEVDRLAKQKKFGLVFEEHLPECTPLYDMPVKTGCQIMMRDSKEDKTVYTVLRLEDGQGTCARKGSKEEPVIFPASDIVRVAEFGEPIYPYLKPLDAVCNAPDSDLWHTLIEADNYHALQLLEYIYAGKVDCIYIDPPYNTGARDWKYNNDYVDGNDNYRHSKWLSFMQRRLKLAKRLLNPKDSVLIVTIDEKEYLHLGCLLEEIFPEANIQMVSTAINGKGVSRGSEFFRVNEYIYFVKMGECLISELGLSDEWLGNIKTSTIKQVRWGSLMRSGTGAERKDSPGCFYPIFISKDKKEFRGAGEVLPVGIDRSTAKIPEDVIAIFPIHDDGSEGRWQYSREKYLELQAKGYARISTQTKKDATIRYISEGWQKKVENGEIEVIGRAEDGSLIFNDDNYEQRYIPGNQWWITSHDATEFGSKLFNKIIGKRFSFPKSLYAVHDAIRFFVANKPDALVLDFFAGSGTTLHAVNLLNAEDGGHRRCIMVTNNEVSETEAKDLAAKGYQPGDEEWNKLGIARYVTWPRTVCSIEGHDINGNPLKGNYLGSDRPMADGFKANAAFFQLGFLEKTAVALGMQLNEMLPLLWMKAGAIGPCPSLYGQDIPDMLILPENKFAVLINENAFASFEQRLKGHPEIQTAYLITDYEVNYRSMKKSLNVETTYQLYRDYLDNFRINRGRN